MTGRGVVTVLLGAVIVGVAVLAVLQLGYLGKLVVRTGHSARGPAGVRDARGWR